MLFDRVGIISYLLTAIVYDKSISNYTNMVIIQISPISLNGTPVVIVSLAVCVLLRSSPRHHVIIAKYEIRNIEIYNLQFIYYLVPYLLLGKSKDLLV